MKHFFLFIILILICSFIGCQNRQGTAYEEKPFIINGTIDDESVTSFIIEYTKLINDSLINDTISVINGSFIIEGIISPGSFSGFLVNDQKVYFYLDPGEMQLYLIKDSIENSILMGSMTQEDFEELELQTGALETYFYKIRNQLNSEQSEKNKDSLKSNKDSIDSLLDSIRIDFIASHLSSYYSLYVFYRLINSEKKNEDILSNLFDRLSKNVRDSYRGKQVYSYILRNRTSKMTNVYSLEAFDKDGNLVKLSDFEGKYIMIDYWATWCKPCINGFPHLKELYSKYKDKCFVVVSISVDIKEDEQKWLDAIEKYNIGEWINILSCKNKEENNICDIRGVMPSPIPHYVLIDKSGNVIKHWRGFSNEIADDQEEMFKNLFENEL